MGKAGFLNERRLFEIVEPRITLSDTKARRFYIVDRKPIIPRTDGWVWPACAYDYGFIPIALAYVEEDGSVLAVPEYTNELGAGMFNCYMQARKFSDKEARNLFNTGTTLTFDSVESLIASRPNVDIFLYRGETHWERIPRSTEDSSK